MPLWWAFWGLQYWQLVISVKLMKPIWRWSAIRIHHNDGRPVDMTVSLNTLNLMTHICVSELDHHWYRSWIFAYTVQGHYLNHFPNEQAAFWEQISMIARFMVPTWGPTGADRTQVGPMWATRKLLSGNASKFGIKIIYELSTIIFANFTQGIAHQYIEYCYSPGVS